MPRPNSPLAWNDSFATGIQEIDEQHRGLLALVAQLADALTQGSGRQEVGRVLAELLTYTNVHFSYEERLMERYHYPGAATHIEEHRALADSVQTFAMRAADGAKAASPVTVLSFLMDWAFGHIQDTDQTMAEFLRNQGVT